MTYMNLPNFLYGMDGGADLTLVGLLTGFIEPPSSLSALTYKKGTKLGKLELLGVKVHIPTGKNNEEITEYMCKGVVPILVDDYICTQYNKKSSGRLALTLRGNVTLARGTKRSKKHNDDENLIIGFKRYISNNVWSATPFPTKLLVKDKDPIYFNLLMKASKKEWVLHSNTDKRINANYIPAGSGVPFKTIVSGIVPSPEVVVEDVIDPNILDISKIGATDLGIVENNVRGSKLDSRAICETDITTLLRNRNVADSKKESKIVTRLTTLPKTGGIKELTNLVDKSNKKVDKLIEDMKELPMSIWSDALEFMALGLSYDWANVGRPLFVGTLIKLFPREEKDILLVESVLGSDFALKWGNSDTIDDYATLSALLANTREVVYLSIIDTVLKLRGNLVNMYYSCKGLELCLLTLMHRNPYYLGLIDTKLSIEELDLLSTLFNIDKTADIVKLRNVVMGHLYMLNGNNRGVGSNTIIKKGYLYYNLIGGDILNKQMYDLLVQTGKIITEDQIKVSKLLFAPTVDVYSLIRDKEGYVEIFSEGIKKYVKTDDSSKNILNDYIESGIGIKVIQEGVEYVTDYVMAEMELYIYHKLHALSKHKTSSLNIDAKKIISEFEYTKSKEFDCIFKLEEMQREAIELVKLNCGCLTGSAGSGKTTTAGLLLYGLERGADYKPSDIVFVAPTGRASARLREVVKRKASTIHSYFGIKGESNSIFNRRKVVEPVEASVVIADEMSMSNVHLMYNLLKRIDTDTRLYLIGDKEQLTPIGFSKPFVLALHFLPTVVLNVSKRASDDSMITLNSKSLIDTDRDYKPLISEKDFQVVGVSVEATESMILSICKYHLGLESAIEGCEAIDSVGKIGIDDIQIVTPVNKGEWGTRNLNKRLQKLFNPRAIASVTNRKGLDSEVVFKVGDRVIHTENHTDTLRLESLGNNTYKKLKDDLQNGIMNGDVGKVVAINYCKDMHFIGDKTLYETYKGGDNTYYLVVEYKDIDSVTSKPISYYILYGFESATHTSHMDARLKGNSLGVLDLAYALTVHKLQGSQARLIVCVIHKLKRKGFITRNMLYTGVTRSKDGCYLIGDVVGVNSAIEEGRKIQQCDYITTTLDKII